MSLFQLSGGQVDLLGAGSAPTGPGAQAGAADDLLSAMDRLQGRLQHVAALFLDNDIYIYICII